MIADLEAAYTQAVERAGASTVSISVAGAFQGPPFGPYARRGIGSGVVLDTQGHILTNAHTVDGAERILVGLGDGRVLGGRVLGADADTDVAVVQVDGDHLQPAELGDSDRLKVGQPVLAIGNPLGLPGGPTVTSGVVSSLQRNIRLGDGDGLQVIQTDAAVNPGNSGGPLVDLQGRVIALNAATIPYAEGIGFAIPINVARDVAAQIIGHGKVQRPWLGVVGYDVDRRLAHYYQLSVSQGVFLVELSEGGPARAAGLRVGDVLTSLDGNPLGGVSDLVEALRGKKIGDTVEVGYERQGGRTVRIPLGTRPF
ncbi:MAG TPA: trypsin-like peptidase domain-containing protein [Thermoplasmata archaeon]|nr:trypsin-like peptidase domain-containing protein [Thermoplasmata archaeon]